jgi:ferrochelatase
MADAKRAVLLLAHGTPDELADIPKYLSNVVSGRPMPESVVEEITHRYGLIGKSPLTALTLEQGRLLSEAVGLPVYVGMRNWKPYIADTVRTMKADGVTDVVAICLAPQNSRTSVGLYRRAAFAEAGDAMRIEFIEGWADHPMLAEAFADRLRAVLDELPTEGTEVLFTAHSVPCRTIQTGTTAGRPGAAPAPALEPGVWIAPAAASVGPDPYPVECKRTAALVAERIPQLSGDRWNFAFQSQGMSGGPWIGPTVEDTLTAMKQGGAKTVVLHTIGFLCDHVEILYDIDIAFTEFAAEQGMELRRPASLNNSPLLTAALSDLAMRGFARFDAEAAPAVALRQ